MNILPQNLQVKTKNILKNKIFNKFQKIFNDNIDDLFNTFTSSKYIYATLNLQKDINNAVIESIKESIEVIDEVFITSEYRKNNYYINKQKVSRSLTTLWGELTFKRNYYTDKNKENGFFLIDKLFGFESYKNYDQIIRGLLIDEAVKTNANKACKNELLYGANILDYLTHKTDEISKIPRQTVYRWLYEFTPKKIEYNEIKTGKILYVMADEKWIHEQIRKNKLDITEQEKKHYIMSKCFIIFTGAKSDKYGRKKLLNRHVFLTSSSTPWKDLMDEISKIYDFEKVKTINLLSDAGNWILAGKDELKLYAHNSIIVNTCEFHVIQKIHRMTSDDDLRQKLIKAIYDNKDKKEFTKLCDELIKSKPQREEKLKGYKNYIINHWKSILNMKICPIKSSMESHISHCVAEHFGSRPKGYSKNNIEKNLKLQEANLNGINILDYFFKSTDLSSENLYNEKEVNFSLFDKSTSLLPTCTSKYPISTLLYDIAYNC